MSNPIAIITGAGRGIGRATAIALCKAGYDIVAVSRTLSDLQETLKSCSDQSFAHVCDVTDPNAVDQLVQTTLHRAKRIDAIVNNAGVAPMQAIDLTTNVIWQDIIHTNLSGAFYLCRAVWPTLVRQKSGAIVNISSEAARDPFPGFAAYAAAKAGINGFTLALAREGKDHNIHVHAVAPAATETQMLRKLFNKESLSEENTLPPQAIANVIVQCINGSMQQTSGECVYVHR